MDRRIIAQMAKGFQTEGTSMNHPPEIDSIEQTVNSLPRTYDPDISTVPFMNYHVTNTNTTTNNNNEGNPEIKPNNEESENKSDESIK